MLKIGKSRLYLLEGRVIRVTGGLQSLDFLIMQAIGSLYHSKCNLTQSYGTWSGCLALRGHAAPEEGQ